MMTVTVAAFIGLGTAYAASLIFATFVQYRGAVSALREMLAQCSDEQEVRIVVQEWNVAGTASILRPDFTRSRAAPNSVRGLRAAA